jgi:hypothetical protein
LQPITIQNESPREVFKELKNLKGLKLLKKRALKNIAGMR